MEEVVNLFMNNDDLSALKLLYSEKAMYTL